MLKYGIELHARGRQIVECHAFEKNGDNVVTSTVIMKGYVSHRTQSAIIVIVPSSNKPAHRFSVFDSGDGFGYEGSPSIRRGWRILLSQLKLEPIPEIIPPPEP